MATFTALASWTSAQDRTAANEIITAYSECRQCVGDSAVAALVAGGNVQDTAFWNDMQDWVEANCVYFVDDDSFSTATEYANVNAIAYTLASFRTEAGIASGFRRATSWPTNWTNYADAAYSYGPIQSGDIVGPWIYEDLQKAFDALRWTYAGGLESVFIFPLLSNPTKTPLSLSYSNVASGVGTSSSEASALDAYNAAVVDWSTGTSILVFAFYYVAAYTLESAGGWSGGVLREQADADFSAIPTHLAHAAEGYYFPGDVAAQFDGFDDLDSTGMIEQKMFSKQSFTSATTATRSIDRFNFSDAPDAPTLDGQAYGVTANYCAVLVMKWTFSFTL